VWQAVLVTETLDLEDRSYGAHVRVLFGERRGKYPSGNSLLVQGRAESVLIDPSLGLHARRAAGRELPRADRLLLSHCHEDHLAGCALYPELPCHVPRLERGALASLDALMELYGYPEPIATSWRKALVEQFHFAPRPAIGYDDGECFDLGGATLRVIHAPGHTVGHSLVHVEPDDVLYLGDIELSSFGPYYGDAASSLVDFERSLARVRELRARWYATFHHIGVLASRDEFLARLERFAAVIADRERRLLAYLAEPRSLDEIALHRFVYRPGDPVSFATAVERRSMEQHLERLSASGQVSEVEPGRYRAA
jgi:glyoxylase-like metal-dependent hydrolase (beta-lactamase superfamily II)